jgi:hypothetical protein
MDFTTDASATSGEARFRYAGRYGDRRADPDTDVGTVFGGAVAITRIRLDATAETRPTLALAPCVPDSTA